MYGEPESYLISALVYLKSDCQMAELTVWKTLKPKPKLRHRLKLRPAMVNWVRQCTGTVVGSSAPAVAGAGRADSSSPPALLLSKTHREREKEKRKGERKEKATVLLFAAYL